MPPRLKASTLGKAALYFRSQEPAMKPFCLILLCLALVQPAHTYATGWLATQLSYQATGWNTGEVYGLNNQGQVVGAIIPPFFAPAGGFIESIPMAFVTNPGGSNLRPLDPHYEPYLPHCAVACNPYPLPTAINDTGQTTMTTQAVSLSTRATASLLGPAGSNTPIPSPISADNFGVTAYLNNSGQVAGTFDGYSGFISYGTDANGTNPHLLGMLDSNYFNRVYAINDSGQLLITGTLTGTTENKTFVTGTNGSGVAFETQTFASSLNNSAQVIGSYFTAPGGEQRAFITGANGVGFTDLGSLGGETFAAAVNNRGLVTGSSGGKAFIYGYQGGGIRDLNQLVALKPGEYFTEAPDINDRGQIVAESNLGHIYLLSPVPEPATYLMFAGGLALVAWRYHLMFHVKRQSIRFV
jgi:hypothetical protein